MDKQPNSRHCFVCGLENPYGLQLRFFQPAPGEVIGEYTVPERFQGYPGIVHGGVVAAMLDEIAGRALMGINPEHSRFMFTARMTIRYRKNVPVGQPLRLVGQAGKERNRFATATAAIYGSGDDLLAEAEALLVDLPEEMFASADMEALGWKVYDDS